MEFLLTLIKNRDFIKIISTVKMMKSTNRDSLNLCVTFVFGIFKVKRVIKLLYEGIHVQMTSRIENTRHCSFSLNICFL